MTKSKINLYKKTNYEALSPIFFLERAANYFPEKIGVIDGNIQKTYAEFYEYCKKLAKALIKIGVKPQTKIAYICRNTHQMLASFYAVPMCQAILVPINIRLSKKEIFYILKHAEAEVLIIEDCFYDSSYSIAVKQIIIINNVNHQQKKLLGYNELINIGKQYNSVELPSIFDEHATITINYTSGTMGHPKGVEYSHRSTYLNSLGESLQCHLDSRTNYLWVLPMFHCNGWCFPWAVTSVCATHVCLNSFNAEEVIKLIIKHDITHLCAAPTVLTLLLCSQNLNLLSAKKNLHIITAGSSPNEKTIEKFEQYDIDIIHVYGLTETHGPYTINSTKNWYKQISKEDAITFKTLQGIPSTHSLHLRVVDDKMLDVPHDGKTMGEVIMRGNNVMKGYYKDQQSTNQVFKNGWFFSGDLGVIHPNGYLEIKDRAKDIIISGGENISSIEVEKAIYTHPAILKVAVIPTVDEIWGEVVHAIVELKAEYTLSKSELIAYCQQHLPRYKCPKKITFAKIPINSTGKIQKLILKKQFYLSKPQI